MPKIDEMTIPYVIDAKPGNGNSYRTLLLAALALNLLLYVWVVLRIVKGSSGAYLKKFTKDYEAAGLTESSAYSDFERAEKDAEKETLRFGQTCLYWTANTTPRAISAKEICWAYKKTTTHRTNGIKTGTTYSLEVYQAHSKEHFSIPLKNDATVDYVLSRIEARYPWVFVGYGDELARTYNKNREEFLNYKYNKVDRNAYGYGEPAQTSYWDPYQQQ